MRQAVSRMGGGSRPRLAGFTLIELLVTLAVLAVLVTLAAPGFQEMMNRNNVVSGTNEVVALLQDARMESVRRNARVEVCPSTNGTTCSGSNDWRRVIVRSTAGTIYRDIALNPRLTARGSSNAGAKIIFRPDGLARQGSAPATVLAGTIEICINASRPAQNARHVAISGARISTNAPVTSTGCAAQVPNS